MEPKKPLRVCGSITKKESLAVVTSNILDKYLVAEADQPFSGYYGRIPDQPQPDSLFLFTEKYYTLEESLRMTQNIQFCAKNKVDVASAVIQFADHCQPAIRIRNFPDYNHLAMLQKCYMEQGVKFKHKTHIEKVAIVTVTKCFSLEPVDEDIFLDNDMIYEGYITVPNYLQWPDFEELMQKVWNNSDCLLFDAAMGGFIIEGRVTDIIRIYSRHLSPELLRCVRKEILKWM
jgi:hypothetical protein